ncbi:MAG: glutamine synthetase type III [Kiritimatiellaeota bacterium]|nr:glutamine synthetase type III [Kiritimatiellota bacterium]
MDEKTPLARSGRALAQQAQRVLSLLGVREGSVFANAGVEQEYFLIDRAFVRQRPDLAICGRTLLGARPPKGQEFADQYFGAIPERVKAYMLDFERELWRLGIAAQTRHNEAAPSQYEFVPCFDRDFMASDHNHVIMQVMQRVAEQHGLTCLLHEKPFAGVNGSGKHVNWSVHTGKRNLFKGGASPSENAPFLVFTAALVRAVHRYARLLRAVVAGAGNDHRLGAHEAPPAIISIFLGESLTTLFERLAMGEAAEPSGYDDRNRTSPFAYTGNKFEFRTVGASQSVSAPLTVLNTILAESLDVAAGALEKELGGGGATAAKRLQAARVVAGAFYRDHKAIVFNGDGYSESWKAEAKARGLPEIADSVEAYAAFNAPEHLALFEQYGVMSAREVNGRAEVYQDRYVKQIATESAVCLEMAEQQALPAIYRYQGDLAATAAALRTIGEKAHTGQLHKATALARTLEDTVESLRDIIGHRPDADTLPRQGAYCRDRVLPAMLAVRHAADAIETVVAENLWPLPKYREILFIQ